MASDSREMWAGLGLDMEKHDTLLSILGEAYPEIYHKQNNRPKGMTYFDFVISEIHGLRVKELDGKSQSKGRESFRDFLPLCSR